MSEGIETEIIDRLFLELSQFTQAKTKRESDLKARLEDAEKRVSKLEQSEFVLKNVLSDTQKQMMEMKQYLNNCQEAYIRCKNALSDLKSQE
jgi:uncharacterized protein YktB (UPF0637 family)